MTGMDTLALTEALIARRSLTPDDAGCCELIGSRLKAAGFTLEYLNAEGVTNLWATFGGGAPLVILAGHTDVVPTGPLSAWASDPFQPSRREGFLHGRGAADMKSGLAAMTCAAERVARRGAARGTLALLVTSDEEGPCRYGTQYVAEILRQRGVKPDYAIVGEATAAAALGDRIVVGRRGSVGCDLRVLGKQGHVAYPLKADNPIHRLAPALAELMALEWDQGNAHFPPTSFQVSNIRGGTGANNVIPGEADCVFNFRYSTELTAETIKARVTAVLDKHLPRHEARWWHTGEPYYTGPGTLTRAATAAVAEVTGRKPELFTGGGTSDGRFLAPLGAQVVEIGPVNATIHQVDERVRIDDLEPLSRIYERLLDTLLAS
ncbi:MAG TPA: succinyl-diaminopimelate desuccinylase [Verrucomicrobiae bacterium]|nr:succinyl-diaminopimelate desuccinylase [Verrucomicrobiae bacterium]